MPFGVLDAFNTPVYSGQQAAHYAGVPYQTLRGWIGEEGLIRTPAPNQLSFNNLAEAHVLKAMRKIHHVPMQAIRKALKELELHRNLAHPLLEQEFETDGVSLCIREGERIVNLNQRSQQEFRDFVSLYLHRIERDATGRATKLYPFLVNDHESEPRSISISPIVSFGRPVLAGTGVSTAVIVGRFTSRDSVPELAAEYRVPLNILEDAIRWELLKGKAA
jgi:uncharacterized protein (DUF433 family)